MTQVTTAPVTHSCTTPRLMKITRTRFHLILLMVSLVLLAGMPHERAWAAGSKSSRHTAEAKQTEEAKQTAETGPTAETKPTAKAHKSSKPRETTPTPTPKYPEIDAQIRTLQQSLADAQNLLNSVQADMTTASLTLLGATTEEYEQRAQIARALSYEYDRNIESLTKLRKLNEERLEPAEADVQLQTFLKQAPFSIDEVDGLRNQILDTRTRIGAIEMRRAMSSGESDKAREDLKTAGVQIRQLQEKLEGVKSKSEEIRLRWQLEQAKLSERLAQARIASQEASANSRNTDLNNQRQIMKLLERKLNAAIANAPFTKKELDEKLDRLRESLNQLQGEMDKAAKARETATARLDETRAALRQARDEINAKNAKAATATTSATTIKATPTATPAARPTATPTATPLGAILASALTDKDSQRLAILQATFDLCKEESDAATSIHNMYRLTLMYWLDYEISVWSARFRCTDPNDPDQYKEIQRLITQGLDQINTKKQSVQANLDLVSSQLTTQQARLESWKPEAGDTRNSRLILTAYQNRADMYRRCLDQIRHTERLLLSWQAETEDRLTHVTMDKRLDGYWHQTKDFMAKMWNYEVMEIQDPNAPGGHRGITIGKILSAIFILIVSIWLCHRVADAMRRIVRRRFRARDSAARLVYKLVFFTGLLIVVLVTMAKLKIPMTIFTFLGGTLAIGIGFGAQNLINNFISGMILLFERPIRVGDVVEVDGQCGAVVGIGGRCSRIKRFDGIDILIPNSSFLEKNVVNWTLSDVLIRKTIKVGVAYGSDPRDVMKLLRQAIEEHKHILKQPGPVVVFDDFGDSALMFTAYFWLEQREGVDPRVVASDVRLHIDKLFSEAGIQMPFPQRDIHLDTARPLQVNLVAGEESVRLTPPPQEM